MSWILGIDPATRYGIGVIDHDGKYDISRTSKLGEHDTNLGKWAGFEYDIAALIGYLKDRGGLDIVAFEEPISFGAARSPNFISPQLCGIIMARCEVANVAYVSVNNSSTKKLAALTGVDFKVKGSAKKKALIEAARVRWPEFDGDDNAADALWIAEWARLNVEDL